MANRLKDRVAVVTGAGRGIGRAIAELLASQGAAVVVNDLGANMDGSGQTASVADEVVAAIKAKGGSAVANGDNVADFTAAGNIIDTAVREFGRVDILVNNAGILRDRMVFNMSEAEWDAVIAVHLKGSFNCTRHASAKMREQRYGRIVSMASSSGVFGNSGQANYGAAKDGIAAMTRVIARDLGRYGITANAVCPAADTRMTQSVGDKARAARASRGIAGPGGTVAPSYKLEHMGPENVAPWVVYLTTDACAHVNGEVFLAMGGLIGHLNYPAPTRTITKDGRWTPEEIATVFSRTFGMDMVNPAPALDPA